jgi:BA14K-like protein
MSGAAMSFIIYFAVLLLTAASVLFGYDLMTSPLPTMPNVPLGRVAHLVAPAPPETPAAKRADARALTPIYPTALGGTDKQASTTGSGSATTAVKPKTEQAASAPPPPAQQVHNQCDVQVCAATYHSFRASDCTYQPYQGPRERCDKTVVASIAAAAKPKLNSPPAPQAQAAPQAKTASPSGRDDASPEVTRIVRRLSADEGDVTVQDADGRIVIVHAGNARAQATCDIAACAASYSSFDAADCTYRSYDGQRLLCQK